MKFLRRIVGHPASIVILPILAVALIAWICLVVGEQNPADPRTDQPERALQEQRDRNGVPQGGVNPSTEQEQAQSEQCAACRYVLNVSDPMIALTFMLLLAALTQARIYHLQANLMTSALTESTKAANATVKSAKIAQNQMYLSLRARMGLKNVTAPHLGPTADTLIWFDFENFGGKGALLERVMILITTDPLLPVPLYAGTWRDLGCPCEKGDHWNMQMSPDPPISPQQWQAVNQEAPGSPRLSIYGVMEYRAGFGTKTKHLGFCRQYDPRSTRLLGTPTFLAVGGQAYNYAE